MKQKKYSLQSFCESAMTYDDIIRLKKEFKKYEKSQKNLSKFLLFSYPFIVSISLFIFYFYSLSVISNIDIFSKVMFYSAITIFSMFIWLAIYMGIYFSVQYLKIPLRITINKDTKEETIYRFKSNELESIDNIDENKLNNPLSQNLMKGIREHKRNATILEKNIIDHINFKLNKI